MYLLGWFAVGFVLANCAAYLARQWPRGGSIKPLWPRHSTASRRTIAGWLGALLIVFLLLLWFVGASDRAGLWEWVIWARSPFLGARFQWLMWGAALGVLAQVFRLEIARISRQAFDATLGKGENTAWALQSTLALLIIAAAVLAIKPDLLSYLRSFEYGGFKATFADHSTNTRLADLNYKDLLWGSTLEQYEEFEESYLGADSDRAKFGDLFVYNKISSERKAITAALLRNYAQPVIRALICFERHHSIDAMAQDVGLVKFGARWVDFLASLKSKDSEITFDIVQPFLHDVSRLGSATSRYMSAIVPDCAPVATVDDVVIRYDAMTIVSNYNNGLAKLREDHRTRPTFRVLALIDAYLVGAAGDLLVVLQGQREKAEFLATMLDRPSETDDMMTPALINVFYQAADAQLKSFRDWPVEGMLANVDQAIKGVDLQISKTSDLVQDYNRNHPMGEKPADVAQGISDPTRFFGAMNRNLMILLAEKLGFFNQRALAGEPLSQAGREEWLRTYSRIIANFSARADAPIVAKDDLPPASVNELSRKMWPSMRIEPEYLVDIDLATAISTLLLEGSQGNPSALSCNTALYYLNGARSNAREFISRKTGEVAADTTVRRVGKVKLTDLHLSRILQTIRNWAGTACEWQADLG